MDRHQQRKRERAKCEGTKRERTNSSDKKEQQAPRTRAQGGVRKHLHRVLGRPGLPEDAPAVHDDRVRADHQVGHTALGLWVG